MINLVHQNLFTKDTRTYHDTVVRLEEIGFVCKDNEDNSSSMCLNFDKRIAFSISDESRIDSDGDNVPDLTDCDGYDPAYQDFFDLPISHPISYGEKRTLRGYSLSDYYYNKGNWVLKPGAKPVKKRWWKE